MTLNDEYHQERIRIIDDALSGAFKIPVSASAEVRLREAIFEAAEWLRNGAPGRALEALERAMTL